MYGERLLIYSSDEELSNFGSGISIDINFAGIVVPFILFPDEAKSSEIIGRNILRDKLSSKKSFEFDNDAILSDSQEFFAKANLLRELRIEQQFVDENIKAGVVRNFYTTEAVKVEKTDLDLSEELETAYTEMLATFKNAKTIPTLAYLGGELLDSVKKYLKAFETIFTGLSDGENLTTQQENALLLGTIEVGRNTCLLYTSDAADD